MPKKLEDYLSLPYTKVLRRDVDDEIFVARVDELPGCSAHGATEQEALSNLRDNMETWIADCIESGDPVPMPTVEEELPSGKWLQRVPRSLHLKLIRLAKSEAVSLNQLVASTLAEAVGDKVAKAEGAPATVPRPYFVYSSVAGTPPMAAGCQQYDLRCELGMGNHLTWPTEIYMGHLREELPTKLPGIQLGNTSHEAKRLASAAKERSNSAEAKKYSYA